MKLHPKEIKLLKEAIENAGARYTDDYSGRGMLGETCEGIIYDDDNQLEEICDFLAENRAKKLAINIATRWKIDNMGLSYIKYNY